MIWGIDICVAYKILLIPYLRQVLISSGTDIYVCIVRNLKGEWEGEIKDKRYSPNRLLFEELKRQILAPVKAIDSTKLGEEEIFLKTINGIKNFRPDLNDEKGRTLLYMVIKKGNSAC